MEYCLDYDREAKNWYASKAINRIRESAQDFSLEAEDITSLRVEGATETGELGQFQNIRELTLFCCDLRDLNILYELPQLRSLGIYYCTIKEVGAIKGLAKLEELSAFGVGSVLPLSGEHSGLKRLRVGMDCVGDPGILRGFGRLEELELGGACADTAFLEGLTQLRKLKLWMCGATNAAALDGLAGLEELSIAEAELSTLEPISVLPRIRKLELCYNPIQQQGIPFRAFACKGALREAGILGFQPAAREMEALEGLETIYVGGKECRDISHLARLPRLEKVCLQECRVENLSPLLELPALREVALYEKAAVPFGYAPAIRALRRRGVAVKLVCMSCAVE